MLNSLKYRYLWIFIFSIIIHNNYLAKAQTPTLELNLNTGYEVVYISDFDFLQQGVADYIFDFSIRNVTQPWPNTVISIQLIVNGENIATATSSPFELYGPVAPAVTRDYYATNIDLISTGKLENITIEDWNTTLNLPEDDDDFQNNLLSSGKIPRGNYVLRITLSHSNPAWSTQIQKTLNIVNPSTIQLITPGIKVGLGAPEEVQTEFPVFQFNSDASEFTVFVYEKLPHHISIDDVINSGNPILEYQTNVPVFTYNNFGAGMPIVAQPLQIGSTYYWFVDAEFMTTSGMENIRSEVWQFKIVDPSVSTGSMPGASTNIEQLLQDFFGPQSASILEELSGFNANTYRVNGAEVTLQELLQIIDSIQNENYEVTDLTVE